MAKRKCHKTPSLDMRVVASKRNDVGVVGKYYPPAGLIASAYVLSIGAGRNPGC
jgi:hypothetical protein